MKIHVGIVNWERDCFIGRSARAAALSEGRPAVTVWDNGSQNPALGAIYDGLQEEGIRVICHCANDGLDRASNLLLERFFADPECEAAFLMEDGCLLMPWTLRIMAETLEREKALENGKGMIGIIGCSLTAGPPCQTLEMIRFPLHWIEDIVERPDDNSPWNGARLGEWRPYHYLAWSSICAPDPFLWGVSRDVYEAVGPLDDGFWQGWGTMNDYCYRAREKGIHAAVTWDAFAITWDRCVRRPWAAEDPGFRTRWMTAGINHMKAKWGDQGWKLMDTNFVQMKRSKDGRLS